MSSIQIVIVFVVVIVSLLLLFLLLFIFYSPFLFMFEYRQTFFYLTAFDRDRAIMRLQVSTAVLFVGLNV